MYSNILFIFYIDVPSSIAYAYANLESLNGNFGMSSKVFAVLITGDTGDKVRIAPLLGDINTGGEAAVGNEFASDSVILQNIPLFKQK